MTTEIKLNQDDLLPILQEYFKSMNGVDVQFVRLDIVDANGTRYDIVNCKAQVTVFANIKKPTSRSQHN